MNEQTLSFEGWCKALDAHHDHLRATEQGFTGYGEGSVVAKTGPECWRDFYDAGDCPEDALAEDRENWA